MAEKTEYAVYSGEGPYWFFLGRNGADRFFLTGSALTDADLRPRIIFGSVEEAIRECDGARDQGLKVAVVRLPFAKSSGPLGGDDPNLSIVYRPQQPDAHRVYLVAKSERWTVPA